MALLRGTRFGPYEITAKIGAGGMGEVYRATDTTLGREVAIKVLAGPFAQDAERLGRFEREAKTLASLNHPNIAMIYGFEKASPTAGSGQATARALVMELVQGPTLADRIDQGAIPLADVLPIAQQIAEALEAAHEAGVIHRDLKPANIKLRSDGVVKVLDFGLAKAFHAAPSGGSGVARSPTVTMPATETGMILGTAPYMSPEQASGKAVDKRTDIWAFGCVLYEMLTGSSPFARDTVTDTLVALLEREPDWTALPTSTPATVRRLLARCLAKDPKLRLRDIGDARADMIAVGSGPVSGGATASLGHASSWGGLGWVVVTIVAAAVAGLVVWRLEPDSPPRAPVSGPVARLVIVPPPGDPIATDMVAVAISPDGRRVAYVAGRGPRQRIYVRDIDQFDSTPLPGTEGGDGPFFSPDGQWVGFVGGGKLRKTRPGGGPPLTITETMQTVSAFASVSWESDDTIFFTPTPGTGIWRVAGAGGTPVAVTTLAGTENSHRWPQLLPGGKMLLFSAAVGSDSQAYVQSLEDGQRRPVLKGTGVRYLPTGHLAYVQAGTLMAVPFDAARLEITGRPVAVLSGFRQLARLRNSTVTNLVPQISFSNAGAIAYLPADPQLGQNSLVWVNRAGVEQATSASGGAYFQPRLSPDGRRVAVTVSGEDHDDVWVYDLMRETWSRFTSEGNSAFPLWTPDGSRLAYASDKAGPDNMYMKPLDGGGREERLLASSRPNYPFAWSHDGSLIFVSVDPVTLQNISLLRPAEKREPTPFLETRFGEGAPALSPDGRWVTYVSNESGRNEIYVRPFRDSGERSTISIEGGNEPLWSPTGRELFYRRGDAMMAVDVSTGPVFAAGKPRVLFEKRYEQTLALWPNYAVGGDGQRFMMVKAIDQGDASSQINVVLNWHEELMRLVPTK